MLASSIDTYAVLGNTYSNVRELYYVTSMKFVNCSPSDASTILSILNKYLRFEGNVSGLQRVLRGMASDGARKVSLYVVGILEIRIHGNVSEERLRGLLVVEIPKASGLEVHTIRFGTPVARTNLSIEIVSREFLREDVLSKFNARALHVSIGSSNEYVSKIAGFSVARVSREETSLFVISVAGSSKDFDELAKLVGNKSIEYEILEMIANIFRYLGSVYRELLRNVTVVKLGLNLCSSILCLSNYVTYFNVGREFIAVAMNDPALAPIVMEIAERVPNALAIEESILVCVEPRNGLLESLYGASCSMAKEILEKLRLGEEGVQRRENVVQTLASHVENENLPTLILILVLSTIIVVAILVLVSFVRRR